jgi:hypothetical protein
MFKIKKETAKEIHKKSNAHMHESTDKNSLHKNSVMLVAWQESFDFDPL